MFNPGQYRAAQQALQQAQRLDPQRADIYCLLAQTQTAQGISSQVQQFWKDCLRYEATATLPEVRQWRDRILEKVLPASKE